MLPPRVRIDDDAERKKVLLGALRPWLRPGRFPWARGLGLRMVRFCRRWGVFSLQEHLICIGRAQGGFRIALELTISTVQTVNQTFLLVYTVSWPPWSNRSSSSSSKDRSGLWSLDDLSTQINYNCYNFFETKRKTKPWPDVIRNL
jgi:hypothetical protein